MRTYTLADLDEPIEDSSAAACDWEWDPAEQTHRHNQHGGKGGLMCLNTHTHACRANAWGAVDALSPAAPCRGGGQGGCPSVACKLQPEPALQLRRCVRGWASISYSNQGCPSVACGLPISPALQLRRYTRGGHLSLKQGLCLCGVQTPSDSPALQLWRCTMG
eukprot:1157911-Pelagomonas_calceolata.AAC.3